MVELINQKCGQTKTPT